MIGTPVKITVTENDLLRVLGSPFAFESQGDRLRLSPAFVRLVAKKLESLYIRSFDQTLITILQDVTPDGYGGIDFTRAEEFCEYVKRKIFRLNHYTESEGHVEPLITDLKEGVLIIQVDHGETENDHHIFEMYIIAQDLAKLDVSFEDLLKKSINYPV